MTQPSRRHFLKTSVVGATALSGSQTFAQSPNPSQKAVSEGEGGDCEGAFSGWSRNSFTPKYFCLLSQEQ